MPLPAGNTAPLSVCVALAICPNARLTCERTSARLLLTILGAAAGVGLTDDEIVVNAAHVLSSPNAPSS